MTAHTCDVAIFGGGIAGLWALHALTNAGYGAVLIERGTLGGAQTLAAQGILHGGMKYALDGKVDDIALRLREMPGRWLDAIAGRGDVKLAGARILSDHQVMWSDGSLLSRLSGALGAKMLRGDVENLPQDQWPEVFAANGYRGTVRLLKETVIDVRSVIQGLADPLAARIFHAPEVKLTADGAALRHAELSVPGQDACRLEAKLFLFTAGTGNEAPAQMLPFAQPATQRRPLKQILIRGAPGKLYGHCIVADPKPRVTVTTHSGPDGILIWYLGGNVAEKAAGMADGEALAFARKEMAAIFPRVDWDACEWAVWSVDRAEPHQSLRFMPAEPAVGAAGNCLLAWPTKMVFAPALAAKIVREVSQRLPATGQPPPVLPLPPATVGKYPWELADWQPKVHA